MRNNMKERSSGCRNIGIICSLVGYVIFSANAYSAQYYVDSVGGTDTNAGTSPANTWQSLERASAQAYEAGDELSLRRGTEYEGALRLTASGTDQAWITINSYGDGGLPVIDATGELGGVHLIDCHYVQVRDLEITANGKNHSKKVEKTFGVYLQSVDNGFSNILISDLKIHDVYATSTTKLSGRHPASSLGIGIGMWGKEMDSSHIVVRNCDIRRTGFKAIEMKHVQHVKILDNFMENIGGPAIQSSRVKDLLVRGNVVEGSGSSLDPRMHARGSGIGPWCSERVLIEHNKFMHARGRGDSCGIHIDFNCRDIVVQYNLSYDNEGGFVEILGNNFNCAYRYNISVNDGSRQKGVNRAFQEGKVLWASGFAGRGTKQHGPHHSYIYNNTVFVKKGSRTCMSFSPSTDGLLIANNIFYIQGETLDVTGDQSTSRNIRVVEDPAYFVSNNLVAHASVFPEGVPFERINELVGNPEFKNPGGRTLEDYIPQNVKLIRDAGIEIDKLPGDEVGLWLGLDVEHDIFGNSIQGRPDLGAIEIGN